MTCLIANRSRMGCKVLVLSEVQGFWLKAQSFFERNINVKPELLTYYGRIWSLSEIERGNYNRKEL